MIMLAQYEIENISCDIIRKTLKSKYRGYVTAWVIDDMLEVSIDNGLYIYYYYCPDFVDFVLEKGTDAVLQELDKEYIIDQHTRFYK